MPRIPAAERRNALAQAALRVIAAQGVAAATTRAIAAEAGMSLASVHYAFSSREELIAFTVRSQVQAALGALAADTGAGDLEGVIRAALRGYLAHIASDPGRELAMFELAHYALRNGRDEDARGQYEANYAAAAEVLNAVAVHMGITWTPPTPDMARIVITLTDGLSLGWLADRDTEAAERVIDFAAAALARLAVAA